MGRKYCVQNCWDNHWPIFQLQLLAHAERSLSKLLHYISLLGKIRFDNSCPKLQMMNGATPVKPNIYPTAKYIKKAPCGALKLFFKKMNYSPLPGFTKPSLASKLNVACGTALSLALSINFPVTRQMP